MNATLRVARVSCCEGAASLHALVVVEKLRLAAHHRELHRAATVAELEQKLVVHVSLGEEDAFAVGKSGRIRHRSDGLNACAEEQMTLVDFLLWFVVVGSQTVDSGLKLFLLLNRLAVRGELVVRGKLCAAATVRLEPTSVERVGHTPFLVGSRGGSSQCVVPSLQRRCTGSPSEAFWRVPAPPTRASRTTAECEARAVAPSGSRPQCRPHCAPGR